MLLFFLVFCLVFQSLPVNVFARGDPKHADIEVYVHGERSNGGAIFNTSGDMGNGLWAPGVKNSGTMRIYNNYSSRVSIHNLAIKLKLYNTITKEEVSDSDLIKEFAEAMKLTIKKGSLLVFETTIYNKSFYEMLYSNDNPDQRGYDLGNLDRISIGTDSSVYLQ